MRSRAAAGPGSGGHAPSGLFPSGPPRPMFREAQPIRSGPLFAGGAMGAAWLLVFALLSTSAGAYGWLTLFASIVAGLCAAVLARSGDRGAAVGVALTTGLGLAIATAVVIERWATTGWPLW